MTAHRQARALRFTGPRAVEIATVDVCQPAGAVLLRSLYSGISSGTELLAYRGELPPDTALDDTLSGLSDGTFRYPFSYGYSCVAEVEAGTEAFPEGSTVFAFAPHQDRFAVAEADLILLDDDVDPRQATLLPLVETALQMTLDADQVFQQPVIVVGQGAVGLLVALMLQHSGARVVAVEPQLWRREVAASLGVDVVAPQEASGVVTELTHGRGVPLVVEASGNPAALVSSLSLLAHEGVALVGSWYGTKPVTLPLGGAFHRRRLTIRSSQVSTIPADQQSRWDIPQRRASARSLLSSLPLAAIATTEFAFSAAADAYAALDGDVEGLLHVALRYD
jgi:2-desacetyl-2-hydroxyethyl bacteriochlorophyllide A dehydrogenase